MKNIVWTYWENPKGVAVEPAYITLCRWTMLHSLNGSALVAVTPENLDKYLPGATAKLKGIEAHSRGRIDRLRRFIRGDSRSLAVKCDIIRAHLLRAYGGIYIDSDAIVLKDLNHYFSLLESNEFFIVRRQSHGKSHVSVGFYGSQQSGKLITEYTEKQNELMSLTKTFDFTSMGETVLTPIIDKLDNRVAFVPEREIQPVTFEESGSTLLRDDIEPDELLQGNESVFMLYHGIFKNQLKNHSIEELYYGNNLVSKLYRRALPERTFNKFSAELI